MKIFEALLCTLVSRQPGSADDGKRATRAADVAFKSVPLESFVFWGARQATGGRADDGKRANSVAYVVWRSVHVEVFFVSFLGRELLIL